LGTLVPLQLLQRSYMLHTPLPFWPWSQMC